jgi:GT2 family glycosyltransferase/glycosyltransferase involved in cell wall biosynthesis
MQDTPRVRVVVLNWNNAWYTRRCLRSLRATDYPADAWELVLVDNGSVDGSAAELAAEFPDVRLVRNPTNLGFAEGCNRAMRDLAGSDMVALVNNDAVVPPDWLRPLVDALVADPSAGAASARLVLEPAFAPVSIDTDDPAELRRIVVDDIDVTAGVRCEGFEERPDPAWPLRPVRTLTGAGQILVPVGASSRWVTVEFNGVAEVQVRTSVDATAGRAGPGGLTVGLGSERVELLNAVGTGLTPLGEGYDLLLGEGDRDDLVPAATHGFCGGGVLLRADLLRDVGWFDPTFFAYYEDTDLSWRARRAGWRVLAVPQSRLLHSLGASGGFRGELFFHLDRRNWLLTSVRNGDADEVLAVLREARRLAEAAFRTNVGSPLKHGRRPDLRLSAAWARIAVDVALAAPRVRRSRNGDLPGSRPTDSVRSRLQPRSRPPRPAHRPGGPRLVYVDVTDTLRSGWRAGIQRVVVGLTTNLPAADERLEVVPVVHVPAYGSFRRTTEAEREALLAPTPQRLEPPPVVVPAGPARRRLVGLLHATGLGERAVAVRTRVQRLRVPRIERDLLLGPLEPGSILLDVDAVWNHGAADRSALLPHLRDAGVHVVPFVHDLLPVERPEWFVPELVASFERTLRAEIGAADLVVANSRATAVSVRAWSAELGRTPPEVIAVHLGVDPPPPVPPVELELPAGARVLLVVGTVEPRKNQRLALEVLDRLDGRDDVHLVLAGRPGWKTEEIAQRIRGHRRYGERLHWFEHVDDATLDALYRRAFVVLVPSVTEGFGLPVLEAIERGAPVIASNGGALPEVAEGIGQLVDPTDVDGWVAAVLRHLDDADHHAGARARVAAAPVPTWADAARELAGVLIDRFGTP